MINDPIYILINSIMLFAVIILYFRIGLGILRKKREHELSFLQKLFGSFFVLVGITNLFILIAYQSYNYEIIFTWMTMVAIVLCVLSGFFISASIFIIAYGEKIFQKFHGLTIWIMFCVGNSILIFILTLNGGIIHNPLDYGMYYYSSFVSQFLLFVFGSMFVFTLVFGLKMYMITDKKIRQPILLLTIALVLFYSAYIMDICMRSGLIPFDFLIISFTMSIIAVLLLKKVCHNKKIEEK